MLDAGRLLKEKSSSGRELGSVQCKTCSVGVADRSLQVRRVGLLSSARAYKSASSSIDSYDAFQTRPLVQNSGADLNGMAIVP